MCCTNQVLYSEYTCRATTQCDLQKWSHDLCNSSADVLEHGAVRNECDSSSPFYSETTDGSAPFTIIFLFLWFLLSAADCVCDLTQDNCSSFFTVVKFRLLSVILVVSVNGNFTISHDSHPRCQCQRLLSVILVVSVNVYCQSSSLSVSTFTVSHPRCQCRREPPIRT